LLCDNVDKNNTWPSAVSQKSKSTTMLISTHTQPFYSSLGFCLGLLRWAGTRKVKPIWIYWSKR